MHPYLREERKVPEEPLPEQLLRKNFFVGSIISVNGRMGAHASGLMRK